MTVNYFEINTGWREKIYPTDISDITTDQMRTILPKAAEGLCEMQYGTGFHLDMMPGGYQAFLYDLRGETPVLLAFTAGVWDNSLRMEVWKELCRRYGKSGEGKVLEMPPAVPYIADCGQPEEQERQGLSVWRRNFTQSLGWTVFEAVKRGMESRK